MRVHVILASAVFLGLAAASCSSGDSSGSNTPTSTSQSLAGLAAGQGRLTGQVGPGRPGENGVIPPLTLTFSDGNRTVKATVLDGRYTVDLPAGTWEVRSDDANLCATGIKVGTMASQRNDLLWPVGSCQDLSGPPASPTPPTGPKPPPS
jgi:hypothetical protein